MAYSDGNNVHHSNCSLFVLFKLVMPASSPFFQTTGFLPDGIYHVGFFLPGFTTLGSREIDPDTLYQEWGSLVQKVFDSVHEHYPNFDQSLYHCHRAVTSLSSTFSTE
jgi:hypothetical protein